METSLHHLPMDANLGDIFLGMRSRDFYNNLLMDLGRQRRRSDASLARIMEMLS